MGPVSRGAACECRRPSRQCARMWVRVGAATAQSTKLYMRSLQVTGYCRFRVLRCTTAHDNDQL
eukprot:scaffold5664_cov115-Isochrysis_galbana.AAC.21